MHAFAKFTIMVIKPVLILRIAQFIIALVGMDQHWLSTDAIAVGINIAMISQDESPFNEALKSGNDFNYGRFPGLNISVVYFSFILSYFNKFAREVLQLSPL
jgi:hypothetical protein